LILPGGKLEGRNESLTRKTTNNAQMKIIKIAILKLVTLTKKNEVLVG
jgi:hypothetical protein